MNDFDYVGSLPTTFETNEEVLTNYRIYGSEDGVGEQTENLLNPENAVDDYAVTNGPVITRTTGYSIVYIPCEPSTRYTGWNLATTSSSNNRIVGFCDANKNLIGYQQYSITSAPKPINTTAETFYIAVTVKTSLIDVSAMVTKGNAEPEIYVPYGYKIPLGSVSGNLVEYTIPQSNIDADGRIVYRSSSYLAVAKIEQGKKYTFVTNDVNLVGYFTTAPRLGDQSYDQQRHGSSELVNPEFVAPIDGYAVYRNTNSSPAELKCTADYNLYIGSTKLGEEEYVDYEEQKVYKRTENLFDKDAKDTEKGYRDNRLLWSNGDVKTSSGYYISEYISVLPNTAYTIVNVAGSSSAVCEYDDAKNYITGTAYGGNTTVTFTTSSTTSTIRLTIIKTKEETIMLMAGSTAPTSYIPYLQPTDPPVPLPSILTYKGSNTLSTSLTTQPLKVGIKYSLADIKKVSLSNTLYNLVDEDFYNLIADQYSETLAYKEGDYCIYDYQLYKCLLPTSGEWSEKCWEQINFADIAIEDGKEVVVNDDDWRIIYEILNGTLSGSFTTDFEEIQGGRFMGCPIDSITLTNCTSISARTFHECSNLSYVNASKCDYIGDYAFYNCISLISYNLPLVSSIGTGAFYNCTSMAEANFPLCELLEQNAFHTCTSLNSINMPLIENIPSSAFRGCTSLSQIVFPNCIAIRSNAFMDCTSLNSVSLPELTTIYYCAFSNCTSLSVLELPNCLSLYSNALWKVSNLKTISLPNANRIGSSAFGNCQKLESIYLLRSTRAALSNANAFANTPISNSTYLGYFGSIYVPESLVDSYKTATNWATYSDRIVAYQE